jgi:outer membrane biosynthesis protein TonB
VQLSYEQWVPVRPARAPWAVLGSVGVHAVLVGLFAMASWLEPPKPSLAQKPVSARLVRLGVKREKNLLPRKDVSAPPPPTVVEIPGTKPMVVKPKELGGAPRSQAEKSRRRDLFRAFERTAIPSTEEPSGDPEGDPEGDSDTAEEGERYFGLVLTKARRNFEVTKTISSRELVRLKATVVLYIGPTGELLKDPEIQISSGNEQYDQDVLLSLKKAAPFGPPPAHLAQALRTVGVAIEARP